MFEHEKGSFLANYKFESFLYFYVIKWLTHDVIETNFRFYQAVVTEKNV